ncbi:MAG TPA: RsmB/NOP family class I SAM-dependent RNA methyltransferase [Opitutaceae bacterium]|nr:RsmB/NOP family class I SAM-dependent RNA methyltransferase [Opitutaceae bacterium]
MSDSLTLNHAARVLNTISSDLPADAALRKYLLNAKRVGPREKRSISQAVFTFFRWLQWLDRNASWQKQVEQALSLQEKFDKNPSSIKIEALAARAVPEWLKSEVEFPPESLRQLQRASALWIRARPGKAAALASALGGCQPVDAATLQRLGISDPAPTALRYVGNQDLFLTPQFHNGEFEIQDLASQLVGYACSPKPGQTWWDACAGEGGKLLHLADMMANKGLIWASDRSERRLQSLKRRATRAKIFNYRTATWDGSAHLPTKTKFDGILLDAPCSGVGTWQRNPHARWSASMNDVVELAEIQRQMLDHVCGSVKSGGRLVYSVCTLTRSETIAVADAFTAAHPEFEPVAVFGDEPKSESANALSSPACAVQETDAFVETKKMLWPHELNANGMFIAAWRRRS